MQLNISKARTLDEQTTLLISLCADVRYSDELHEMLGSNVLEDDWARLLAAWGMEYVRKYREPSLKALQDIARQNRNTISDASTAEMLCTMAATLLQLYEDNQSVFSNFQYVLEKDIAYIRRRNLENLLASLENSLDSGNLGGAENAVLAYSKVQRIECTSVNMMMDANKINSAYMTEEGDLFRMRGSLGELCGTFGRGDFALVLGQSGTGKSWVCQQIAKEATMRGLQVLYINLENTQRKMIQRCYTSICGLPRQDSDVIIPRFVKTEGSDKWDIVHESIPMRAIPTDTEGIAKMLARHRMRCNGGRMEVLSYPPGLMTMRDIETEIGKLEQYKGFCPDVIVVDYLNLIRSDNTRQDKRLQVDEVSLGLRSMALARNVMVISPIQSNREGYDKELTAKNVAENIGNVSHATYVLALSHSAKEKEKGIMRIRILKNRDNKEYATPIIALGCLDIGQPILDTRWRDEVNFSED